MRTIPVSILAWFAAVLLTSSAPALAALPTPYAASCVAHQVRIPMLAPSGELHADLERAPWDRAAVLTGNLDWRRIRTTELPVRTYLYYDREALYLGYRCEVHGTKTIKAEVRERDQDLKRDEHFTFELDAGPTGRVFYRFVVNPLGTLTDSVIIDKGWNSHAQIKTQTDEQGWSAAMRIPFSDFERGTPEPNSAWTFNLATRSGYDNCWAPVLGGYHTPEEFARLIFGGEQTQAARMIEFKPLHAGPNALRVAAPEGARYRLEAIDADDRLASRQEGAVGADGRIRFMLLDDRIRHVNFVFQDAAGRDLLTFWRPAEIPALISRLPGIAEKCTLVRGQIARFPQALQPEMTALLAEVDALLDAPAESIYADWSKLHDKLNLLDRRVTDAWLYTQTLGRSGQARFAIALATPMDNVMIQDFPCPGTPGDSYALEVARNEQEAMQVVVIPMTGALKNLAVSASPAVGTQDGAALAGKVTVALVGHVKTRPAGSYLPDYVGWYPDPILDFQQSCDAAQGEHVAFWVDVAAVRNARPGDYHSTLTVSADGGEALTVRLNIRVWDIELPDGSHLRNAFTYNPPATKRLYKERWSPAMARKYQDFILDHRLNVDSLYGKEERDVEMLRHGAARGMNAFNLFYVGRGAGADVVRKLLDERVPALKAAGVYPLAYLYGFDEVNDEIFPRIKEVFGLVHELYPDLPRMTTGYDNTFGRTTGLRNHVDIWVPLIPRYDMVEADRLRAEGKEMWWYLCVGPRHPYPNWFVDSPAIEGRLLMGAMSYKYQVGGVLYFMMNGWSLIEQPISKGPYTDWFPGAGKSRDGIYANGDGSIFCAGPDGPVTTIRFENIRDGLEDYEYLFALAEAVKQVAAQPSTLKRTQFLQEARELLGVPEEVVESSSRYTRDPRRVHQLRRSVAEMILRGRGLAR